MPSLNLTLTTNDTRLVGWVSPGEGRGTWTLLISCLSTIFLCTWVVIHPRIDCRPKFRLLHKLALFVKAVIGPEFIAVEAVQEWGQAQRTVRHCKELTHGEFKLIHAYYVGMFGLRYRVDDRDVTPQRTDGKPSTKILWPNQYTWLLNRGYITWNEKYQEDWGLDEAIIKDKSNADPAAKLLALIGVAKFSFDSIYRLWLSLPLAPLEVVTLAYIPLFALTYAFWWLKPKDVYVATIVDLPAMKVDDFYEFESLGLTDIFDDEGKDYQQSIGGIWQLTPRDFELNLFHHELPTVSKRYGQGAVLASWDPDIYRSKVLWPVTCLFGASFGALHLISWNTVFPTVAEQWMWRVSAMISIVAILVFMHFRQVILQWSKIESLISVAAAVLYLAGRLFVIVEVFASLRASQPAIYAT